MKWLLKSSEKIENWINSHPLPDNNIIGYSIMFIVLVCMFIYYIIIFYDTNLIPQQIQEKDPFKILENMMLVSVTLLTLFNLSYQLNINSKKEKEIKDTSDKIEQAVIKLDNKINDFSNLQHSSDKMSLFSEEGRSKLDGLEESNDPSKSYFDIRNRHFSAEKRFICLKALDRISKSEQEWRKEHKDKKRTLYLLIDSGSTVYPIFELLCEYRNFKDTFKDVVIYTNNIRGISKISDYARKNDRKDQSIIYKCKAIPGEIEEKYAAIVGKPAVEYLEGLLELIYCDEFVQASLSESQELSKIQKLSKLNEKAIIVSLITGNYISTREGILWRGDFHGELKYNLISNSHHIYVLSPLGKIFNKSAKRINEIIQSSEVPFASQKEYKTLDQFEFDLCGDLDKDCTKIKWILSNGFGKDMKKISDEENGILKKFLDHGFSDPGVCEISIRECKLRAKKREQDGKWIASISSHEPGIEKLIPKVLLDQKTESFKREVYLITTYRGANYRGENKGLLYPDVLSNYFASISTSIEENFKSSKDESGKDKKILFRDEFNPQNDSYQVVRQLNILKDPAEVLFNYEFPHREIRTEMKRYINSTDIYAYEE